MSALTRLTERGWWSSAGQQTPSNDATAEIVVWLDEVHQAVGHE